MGSINDINSFNLERIITVKGSIDNMSKSEALISSKLRQSYENDLQAMAVSTRLPTILHAKRLAGVVRHAVTLGNRRQAAPIWFFKIKL
jgi:hypothetical protein